MRCIVLPGDGGRGDTWYIPPGWVWCIYRLFPGMMVPLPGWSVHATLLVIGPASTAAPTEVGCAPP